MMQPKLKILHISFHKEWRGGEQQAAYLYEELKKKSCKQWFLCARGNAMNNYCINNNIPFYSLKTGLLNNIKNRSIINFICIKNEIDIIHVHDSKAHTFLFINSLFTKLPKVIVSRRVDFPVHSSFLSKKKYNCDCIKKYICISKTVKDILEPAIKDKTKLEVVHSGIDVKKFEGKQNTNKLRNEYSLKNEEIIIANTSAIADHKDYFTFVDTAEDLLKKNINAKFFIIGKGPLEKEIKTYIDKKGLVKNIILTGFRNDIPEILPEVDVFLFTSKTEGLGTTILDAMACGVPVVATNAGGVSEIIKHKENGFIAQVKNIKELSEFVELAIKDEALKNKILANAKKTLKHFSKRKMAEGNLVVYKKILNR